MGKKYCLDTKAGSGRTSKRASSRPNPNFHFPLHLDPRPRRNTAVYSTMADPLSITASLLTILTTAIQSTNSLLEAVRRYKERNKTLGRLCEELEDLISILKSLEKACRSDSPTLDLLGRPIRRCSQLCSEFEATMKEFGAKPNVGFRDWAKMEFMRGDINEFLDTLAGYKSTISVGLGAIIMLVLQSVK